EVEQRRALGRGLRGAPLVRGRSGARLAVDELVDRVQDLTDLAGRLRAATAAVIVAGAGRGQDAVELDQRPEHAALEPPQDAQADEERDDRDEHRGPRAALAEALGG